MRPYLELPHLLSLTWLAYPVISLLFVAFRLQLSLESSQNAVANAKSDLLAACSAAEKAATSAASLPRYLAITTNLHIAEAVNGTIKSAQELLTLALTGMEAVINFIVDIYRSTFLCLLELAVRSGLQVLILAVQEFNTLLNNTASSLRTGIQNDIAKANSIIQSAVDTINKANPFSKITAPQIAVPSLDGLQNLTLPSTFQDALVQLNNTIPSVDDLKQRVTDLLDKPFELVKADINDTFVNIPAFDAALLPVPSQNTVTFCDQLDTSVVDELSEELVKMAKIGFAILILTALLLIGLNCLLTWYKWRALKRHLNFTRQAWMSDPALDHTKSPSNVPEIVLTDHNLLMLQANMHHPFITRLLHKLAAKLRLTPAQHCNIRWFFHYIFHPPALACFLIGFFGLLSVEIQLLALRPLEAQFSKQVVAATADFSHTIATTVNTTMFNQSATYAHNINSRVDVIQSTIDDKMFGWVNETTTTLNATVNAFYADVQNAVSTLFNGSILEAPAQDFIKCFLGSKVDAIEKTLTFLHDNLHVNIPRVNNSVLVLSPGTIDEVTLPIARAAVGSGNNDNTGVVGKIIKTYEASLKKERFVFSIFMYLWAVVVFMGIVILLWSAYGRQWLENRRRRRWQKEQRSGINGVIIPFREGLKEERLDGRITPNSLSLPPVRTSPFRPFSTLNNHGASPANASLAAFAPTHPRFKSDDTLVMYSNGDADSFYGGFKGAEPRPLTAMDKLRAFGKKAFGRDRTHPEVSHMHQKKPETDESSPRDRDLAWIGRVRSKLAQNLNNPQTQARSLDEKSTSEEKRVTSSPGNAGNMKSNDTATPTSVKTNPWRTTSTRHEPSPSSPPAYTSIRQLKSVPQLIPTPRYTTNVPQDVDPRASKDQLDEQSESHMMRTIAPMPLHHGFVDSTPYTPQTQTRVSQPPIFDWTSKAGLSVLPNGKPSPRVSTSVISSAFSEDTSPFTPVPESPSWSNRARSKSPKRGKQYHSPNGEQGASITPVTRLLTITHARQSSETVNPFVSPFDDEHRVTIETENPARKSIATNPTGVAL